jgi:PleD family two-component response regulator
MNNYYLKYKKYKTKYLNLQYGGDATPSGMQAGIKEEVAKLSSGSAVADMKQIITLDAQLKIQEEYIKSQKEYINNLKNYEQDSLTNINNARQELNRIKNELTALKSKKNLE